MLVILVIILVLLGAAVVGSIYSTFIVFYSNFSETENYHKAYYASISALERGELVTRQRKPGYVGSGGFILGTGQGSLSNGGSDGSLSGFSYFGENKEQTSVFRDINSRTTRIPAKGKGDVERMLSTGDSDDYNMMNYENAEMFLLTYDNELNRNPYSTPNNLQKSEPGSITGTIRLPGLLIDRGFGLLNTGISLVGVLGNLPEDDAIVDWQIEGEILTGIHWVPFTIYSTQSTEFYGNNVKVVYQNDNVFRESNINNVLNFKFGSVGWSPFNNVNKGNSITVISQAEDDIKGKNNYKDLLDLLPNNELKIDNIRFSLVNLLQTVGNDIYPFLEYYIDFGTTVSDKYYTIKAEGEYKDYKVDIVIKKPTVKSSIFGNFTSIF